MALMVSCGEVGTIVARDLRGEDLQTKLAELFN